ncbi:MAG: precorrin-6y C5,15-methyltransferase (decarboxylating) subunit CbiE, partial [Candidatus Korobacteraceae bacterium]
DYLTPAARTSIAGAEVLVGASRLLKLFAANGAERIVVGTDIPKALDQLASHIGKRKVVVMVSGDPGLCSLAQPVIQRFGWQSCQVIPGISSVQVAFARLGLDWTGARLLSAHHHAPQVDLDALAEENKIAVLAGNASALAWIAGLAKRLAATHSIFACEDLTLPQERVFRLGPDDLAGGKLSAQSIVLFIGKKIRT